MAAREGDVAKALRWIERGASPRVGAEGLTALHVAALMGREAMVAALLPMSDASLADYEGKTALMRACQHGREGCVRLLLAAGADALARDLEGQNALMMACRQARDGCARALLELESAREQAMAQDRREGWVAMAHALHGQFVSQPLALRCVEALSPWTDLETVIGAATVERWLGEDLAARVRAAKAVWQAAELAKEAGVSQSLPRARL